MYLYYAASLPQNIKCIDPNFGFSNVRFVKSPAEIDLMRQSGKIAAIAMTETMKFTKPNLPEQSLAAKFEFECKSRGAKRLSYPCVVAGGINANTLHYIDNDDVLRFAHLLCNEI